MTGPTFLSLFSGIGGLDLGLHRAGWECIGQVEADPWRRDILARHWPDIPQHDDVTTFDPEGITCDLVAGGFPCQDLSVAGRRAGLGGDRSRLFWDGLRIIDVVRPKRVLLENVVGLLTSHRGNDFRMVVGALADLGYGVGWRTLNSAYFRVPQHRRRVFIVAVDAPGRPGAERAGAILGVGTSCERHPAPGAEAGEAGATGAAGGPADGGGMGDISPAVTRKWAKGSGGPAGDECQNLTAAGGVLLRLTPVECARLQGFPDDWLGAPNAKPDGPRYEAIGDSVTVPVAEWLGCRLMEAA